MRSEPFETHKLENGVVIRLFDLSRKIAADRWYLELMVRIHLPLAPFLSEFPAEKGAAIQDAFGTELTWEQSRKRNFIDKSQKEQVFQDLKQSFLHTISYYAMADFPIRFISKRYREYEEKQRYLRYQSGNRA